MQFFCMVKVAIAPRIKGTTWGHIPSYRSIKACYLGLQHTSLKLYIQAMVNWQLWKQGICWPIPCDHITGSGLERTKVQCFFLELTAANFLDQINSVANTSFSSKPSPLTHSLRLISQTSVFNKVEIRDPKCFFLNSLHWYLISCVKVISVFHNSSSKCHFSPSYKNIIKNSLPLKNFLPDHLLICDNPFIAIILQNE